MDQEYQNILVPVDGSQESEFALHRAIAIAKRNGAHIDILNVIDTRAMAYNFAGMLQGVDLSYNYPEGTKPYTIGEMSNTITNYGFDPITQISEYNAGLCRIEKA